jgi:hypothetical protein
MFLYSLVTLALAALSQQKMALAVPVAQTDSSYGYGMTGTYGGTGVSVGETTLSYYGCPAGKSYYAAIFEGYDYGGITHWVDGTSGECRGLNGTNIGSVHILTKVGGDPISERASSAYAEGVTITYFTEFGCAGTEMGKSIGNRAYITNVNGAKSVRIECNGRSFGDDTPQPMQAPYAVKLYEGEHYTGISHQTDGSDGECRGLSGVTVASAQFLASASSTEPLSDADSKMYGVILFDEYNCDGKRLGTLFGNKDRVLAWPYSPFLIGGGSSPQPKSLKFISISYNSYATGLLISSGPVQGLPS